MRTHVKRNEDKISIDGGKLLGTCDARQLAWEINRQVDEIERGWDDEEFAGELFRADLPEKAQEIILDFLGLTMLDPDDRNSEGIRLVMSALERALYPNADEFVFYREGLPAAFKKFVRQSLFLGEEEENWGPLLDFLRKYKQEF